MLIMTDWWLTVLTLCKTMGIVAEMGIHDSESDAIADELNRSFESYNYTNINISDFSVFSSQNVCSKQMWIHDKQICVSDPDYDSNEQ